MELQSNYKKALEWIDAQDIQVGIDLDLGNGVFINDLNKCLQTNKERLLNCEGYIQKLSYLKIKMIKDKLNQK